MGQELYEWALIFGRWVHITTAVTWIGTSIFFMWLDRSFVKNENATREGHVGDLWMVHGGGFYHVEKLLMGPTKVPERLHWFKWEAYWTWMSGFFLVVMIFYTGDGTFLLDEEVSSISYPQGVGIGLFSLIGSWVFYDQLWERRATRLHPLLGHVLTALWFVGMAYFLCHTLSGRAAYIHIGGMIGTWMTANVFMRIIPRQLKMVEASKSGTPVNQEWAQNAKNRSTHNTYLTLPVIFIMLSNHFPSTYGHDLNWVLLILICIAGASIREYFVIRLKDPKRAYIFAGMGILMLTFIMATFGDKGQNYETSEVVQSNVEQTPTNIESKKIIANKVSLNGVIYFKGKVPKGKKLRLPKVCAKQYSEDVYSDEVRIKNGKLENVLVRIVKGHEQLNFGNIPTTPKKLDQRGCIYRPRVLGVRVGQPLEITNSDDIFHNVKSLAKNNKRFNINMPKQNQKEIVSFKNPEILLKAKCNMHPWMGVYIAVVEHPFFDVSKSDGRFQLNDVPEGDYTIEAWHEKFGTLTQEITLNENNSTIEFSFRSNK